MKTTLVRGGSDAELIDKRTESVPPLLLSPTKPSPIATHLTILIHNDFCFMGLDVPVILHKNIAMFRASKYKDSLVNWIGRG